MKYLILIIITDRVFIKKVDYNLNLKSCIWKDKEEQEESLDGRNIKSYKYGNKNMQDII